jgi:serine phosphatase RsbU (regulator of sigma subunit)/anti-sigma regulatory factor (Ser/Thr protein kinase)
MTSTFTTRAGQAADDGTDATVETVTAPLPAPPARPARSGLWRRRARSDAQPALPAQRPTTVVTPDFAIAPNDPIIGFFSSAHGAVDITGLELDSPALSAMRAAGVVLVVPLVASGELIGLLNLGPRLSERGYSTDDRQLLDSLAGYAAPAIRLGQLVRDQQAQALTRERIEQELKVAQLIQQQFLPTSVPDLPQWEVAAFYRPARTVGGDFYDFIDLPDGRLMVVVGDVTDKGVPAALVMASTHALLRATGPRLLAPGEVLARVNDLLYRDIPAHMFVTCLALVLDPATGQVEYANAGHDLPYLRTATGVVEMRAVGMPLGLMPDMVYEEQQVTLAPGDHLLLHSDGLAEAHDESRQMFGFPRVAELAGRPACGVEMIEECLAELAAFTGPGQEQEDDITLVTLQRKGGGQMKSDAGQAAQLLAEFVVASVPGNERVALARVAEAVAEKGLPESRMEQLKTAVAEATMNAIEHGNHNDAQREVRLRVLGFPDAVEVEVRDRGGAPADAGTAEPDLDLKLAGQQSPRGWGLFLMRHMVDAMDVSHDGVWHTVRLRMRTGDCADPIGDGDDQ